MASTTATASPARRTPTRALLRTYAVETFFAQHRQGLALLGIPVPERM